MYWPKDVDTSHSYGFIEVTLEKEEVMANYTIRTMKIKHTKVSRPHYRSTYPDEYFMTA